MDKQYFFKVVARNVTSLRNSRVDHVSLEEDVTIQINDSERTLPSCFLSLGYDKVNNNLFIKKAIFSANETVKESDVSGYLKGYFGFNSEAAISSSLEELIDLLNRQSPNYSSNTTWSVFVQQFQEWFKYKLRPCLEKEIELHMMYYSPELLCLPTNLN